MAQNPNDMPLVRISFTDGTGTKLAAPIEVRLPEGLSLKTARLCLTELVNKSLKTGLDAALTALGFKE